MAREFQFTPTATVAVDDDGTVNLSIDWAECSQGEWDEGRLEYILNEATARVCVVLDEYAKRTAEPVTIGRLDCLPEQQTGEQPD